MINKAMLVGYLGANPELKYTQTGAAVANISVATSKKFKDKEGVLNDETQWHRVVAWNKQAESCEKYLKKGSMVYVEGEIRTRQWEDKEGQKRWTTEIVASRVQFLDRKGSSNAPKNDSSFEQIPDIGDDDVGF